MPNYSPMSNMTPTRDPGREATVARVLEGYETLMHRLVSSHLPEFMEVAVTMSQAKVLYTVLAAGSLRMSELAARLRVSVSTTSGQVERLVEQGLLDRRDDPADRRQVVVSVTTAGADLLGRFRELNNEQLMLLLARIDDDSLELIERAIRILAEAADPIEVAHPADPTEVADPVAADHPELAVDAPLGADHRKDQHL
jgi:DNA-binding MarR family transcriptional regulator